MQCNQLAIATNKQTKKIRKKDNHDVLRALLKVSPLFSPLHFCLLDSLEQDTVLKYGLIVLLRNVLAFLHIVMFVEDLGYVLQHGQTSQRVADYMI